MKNKYMESLRKRWKLRENSWRNAVNGVFVYHCYDEPKKESWWDDFGFYINGVYHVVWWVHPRMAFKDEVEYRAHNEVQHLYPGRHDDGGLFSGGKKNYKKVGKSRKKVTSIECAPPNISKKEWFNLYQEAEHNQLKTTDYVALPKIKTTWLKYGKGIDICYPVELLSEKDIIEFAKRLKYCIVNNQNILEDLYDYDGYSKDDWAKEGHLSWLERQQGLKEVLSDE